MRIRGALIGLLGLLLAAVAAPSERAQSLVNRKAPAFAVRDLSGGPIDLARLHGKVVLLNFWATWCAPCQAEMPRFADWQQRYASQGLAVVGISMDDSDQPVRKVVQKLHIGYPVGMGTAGLGKSYGGVLGLPETYLIDRNGVVRAKFQGEADLGKIEAEVKNLLRTR